MSIFSYIPNSNLIKISHKFFTFRFCCCCCLNLLPVLHAPNQLVQSMNDGVRLAFNRHSRPPNIPSPPPLIPTNKPTDKPSFIYGGSISQVRHPAPSVEPQSPYLSTLLIFSVSVGKSNSVTDFMWTV